MDRQTVHLSVALCRNEPPPHILLNLLQKLNHAGRVNKHTKEKTVKIFKVTHRPQGRPCYANMAAPPQR